MINVLKCEATLLTFLNIKAHDYEKTNKQNEKWGKSVTLRKRKLNYMRLTAKHNNFFSCSCEVFKNIFFFTNYEAKKFLLMNTIFSSFHLCNTKCSSRVFLTLIKEFMDWNRTCEENNVGVWLRHVKIN